MSFLSPLPPLEQTVKYICALHYNHANNKGASYAQHPIRVLMRLGRFASDRDGHVALLHDVMDDCGVSASDLLERGYSQDIVEAVTLLSKPQGMSFRDYLTRLLTSGNKLALRVQLADYYDNSDSRHLNGLTTEHRAVVEQQIETQYHPAIDRIKAVLGDTAMDIMSDPI